METHFLSPSFLSSLIGAGGSSSIGGGGGVVTIVYPIHAIIPNIPITAITAVICKISNG